MSTTNGISPERRLDRNEVREALLLRGEDQQALFQRARLSRARHFEDGDIEVRSVLEISNLCRQECLYCNMARGHGLERYVMAPEQVVEIVEATYQKGRRFFLLQSGENLSQSFLNGVAKATRQIKDRMPDATLILCLGALSRANYDLLRDNGADRYILKFETSSPELYAVMKPKENLKDRLDSLQAAIDAGLQAGTGNIVGLPGQSLDSIVEDLLLTCEYPLGMVSASVFIPGENSALAQAPFGCVDTTLNAMALLRIMHPALRIPSTSSLEKAREGAQLMGLKAGANTVTIHDATPADRKALFPIYSPQRFVPDEQYCMNILGASKQTG